MGRESLPPPGEHSPDDSNHRGRQDVAYKLASYLLIAKSDKKAAAIFSRTDSSLSFPSSLLSFPRRRESNEKKLSRRKTKQLAINYLRQKRLDPGSESGMTDNLSETQQQKLTEIRQELAVADQIYLNEKKDKFTTFDRAKILFDAKLSKFNGLSKEEKVTMYQEAGYSEDEIMKITGKKLLLSTGLSTGLTFISNGLTGAAIANEKIVPFIENIPDNYSGMAVGASLLTYVASYAYITEQDLKLTKEVGGSTNPYVTGVYLAGDRLLSNRTRDWFARGLPIATNAVTHAVAIPTVIESVTENSDKIIAGSLAGSAFNVALAVGCEVFLRKKKKGKPINAK